MKASTKTRAETTQAKTLSCQPSSLFLKLYLELGANKVASKGNFRALSSIEHKASSRLPQADLEYKSSDNELQSPPDLCLDIMSFCGHFLFFKIPNS